MILSQTDLSNSIQKVTKTTDISTTQGFRDLICIQGTRDTEEEKEIAITLYTTGSALPPSSALTAFTATWGRSTANIPNNIFLLSRTTDPTESSSDMTMDIESNFNFTSPVDVTPGLNASERISHSLGHALLSFWS